MASREIPLRREDVCVACREPLAPGVRAWWDPDAKTVTCLACRAAAVQESSEIDPGIAGQSISRAHQARKSRREQRVRDKHPRIGGALLALQSAPQHEEAFRKGAAGERQVAAALAKRVPDGTAELLHNRRMSGGRGDIDHLAVSPTGVWVIDAKAIAGKARIARPLLRDQRLIVNGRDRSKLLDGLDRQVAAVREALTQFPDVQIRGVLCFTDADLPLLRREVRGHVLLHQHGLARSLKNDGPILAEQRSEILRVLARAFPPA